MKKSLASLVLLVPILLAGCGPSPSSTTTSVSSDGTTVTKTTTTTTPTDSAPAIPPAPVSTLTQANLDKVQTDMSKAEVEAIFGQPTSSSTQPIPIVGGDQTTYNYQTGTSAVTIVFKNDKVKEKSGTFNP